MNDSSNISYSSFNEITENINITRGDYRSTNASENAILVSGDIDVTLENISVTKTGDSDGGDNTSFYGTNSALIAKDRAHLTLKILLLKQMLLEQMEYLVMVALLLQIIHIVMVQQ